MRKNPIKEVRLNKREFQQTAREGIRIKCADMRIFYRKNALSSVRYAVGVGRKYGKAVERNRVKRILKESFRALKSDALHSYDIVVIVYDKNFSLVQRMQQMQMLFNKLER